MAELMLGVLAFVAAVLAFWLIAHAMCRTSSLMESPLQAVLVGGGVVVLVALLCAFVFETLPGLMLLQLNGWGFAIAGLLGTGCGMLSAYRSNRQKARA